MKENFGIKVKERIKKFLVVMTIGQLIIYKKEQNINKITNKLSLKIKIFPYLMVNIIFPTNK